MCIRDSKNTGWVVGSHGTILKTIDGGLDWISQESNSSEVLISISIIDSENIWITGHNGTLLQTSTGGETWGSHSSFTLNNIESISFVNDLTGFALTSSGEIFKTNDSGMTWNRDSINSNQIHSIHFFDKHTGWVTGSRGLIGKKK